jgi:hypothetical protein
MKLFLQAPSQLLCTLALAGVLTLSSSISWATPGAHGPNGEHLDVPALTGSSAEAAPSFEAHSELFELAGRLQGGELSMLIHRYETNEPVQQADVEVESGALTAKAPFHSDIGDYAVADPALLKLLGTPGEHALVMTIKAGNDVDLLDGVLRVPGPTDTHAGDQSHGHGVPRSAWVIAVFLANIAAGSLWSRRQRRTAGATAQGAAQ